ncbi:MAG: hypothetical protein JNG84_12910 [Archangium sp.]|nr:hypothetical protein [Archangium sp.]
MLTRLSRTTSATLLEGNDDTEPTPTERPLDVVVPFDGPRLQPRAEAPREALAAETLARLLDGAPEVAAQLPPFCETASSKLLYLATHRALSAQLRNRTFNVPLGVDDTLTVHAGGSLTLSMGRGERITLNNTHGDLARLLDGAHAQTTPPEVSPYLEVPARGLEVGLGNAVTRHHRNLTFDGGGAAANARGGRAFSYATIQQVLVSPDPSQRGLECLASASFHLFKSMGLVPPELTRAELERRYTSIHGVRSPSPHRLGPEFDKTLRGIPSSNPSDVRLDAAQTAAFANALRTDDWAKLTGAAQGPYRVRELPTVEALVAHFQAGGAGVRTSWADNGHYFVLSGAQYGASGVTVNVDDSLRWKAPIKRTPDEQAALTAYEPNHHTRFWTLLR